MAGFHYVLRDGAWSALADEALELVDVDDPAAGLHELLRQAAARPVVSEALLGKPRERAASVRRDGVLQARVETHREGVE